MKGVFHWLARWTCCAGTRDFCPAWLLWLAQYKILILHRTLLYFFYFPEFSAILANNSAPGTEVRTMQMGVMFVAHHPEMGLTSSGGRQVRMIDLLSPIDLPVVSTDTIC